MVSPFRHPEKPAGLIAREEADEAIDAAIADAAARRLHDEEKSTRRRALLRRVFLTTLTVLGVVMLGIVITLLFTEPHQRPRGFDQAAGLTCMLGSMAWLFLLVGYLLARIKPKPASNQFTPPNS